MTIISHVTDSHGGDHPRREESGLDAVPDQPDRALSRQERRARLNRLRHEITRIEMAGAYGADRSRGQGSGQELVTLGIREIDDHLGGGLRRHALHEISSGDGTGTDESGMAAVGFALALLGRLLAGRAARWLWCSAETLPYGPAVAAFGLDPRSALVVRTGNDEETLWATEEALASASLTAVCATVHVLPPVAARRLSLAARHHGTTALLLPRSKVSTALPAASRWRVSGAPRRVSGPAESWRWRLELLRAGGTSPHSWHVAGRAGSGSLIPPVIDLCRNAGIPRSSLSAAEVETDASQDSVH